MIGPGACGSLPEKSIVSERPRLIARTCTFTGLVKSTPSLPKYVEVERNGPDHAPHFTSEVRIVGKPPARGEGASKRAAEQAAARALLEREGVRGAAVHE